MQESHGLEGNMRRRGNCHDNAVAESFFQLLKRERIKKKKHMPLFSPPYLSANIVIRAQPPAVNRAAISRKRSGS